VPIFGPTASTQVLFVPWALPNGGMNDLVACQP
jgi:hypothetical protein